MMMARQKPAMLPSGARRAKAMVLALLATSCIRAGTGAEAREYATVVEERAYSQSTGLMTTQKFSVTVSTGEETPASPGAS